MILHPGAQRLGNRAELAVSPWLREPAMFYRSLGARFYTALLPNNGEKPMIRTFDPRS